MIAEPDKEQEKQEAPDRFIEEGGVIADTIYDLSPGKISLYTMRFFIKEITPASDGLTKSQHRGA